MLSVRNSSGVVARIDGFSEEEFVFYAKLLDEAGLVNASFMPENKIIPNAAIIHRITWQGHDFIDLIKDDSKWDKVKDIVSSPAGSWTFSLLSKLLESEAGKVLGIG